MGRVVPTKGNIVNTVKRPLISWETFGGYILRVSLITWIEFEGYLLGHFTAHNITRIKKAFELAHEAHFGKIRLDGTPYFNHVVRAAMLALIFKVYDVDLIITILCHDVKEENKSIQPWRFIIFGQGNVNRLHMLTKSPHENRKALYFPSLLKCDDWRTLFAKAFDRLDNQMTLKRAGTPKWRLGKNLETVKYFPRLLKRTEFLLRLSVRKDLLPRHPYWNVMEEVTNKYCEVMTKKYKSRFIYVKGEPAPVIYPKSNPLPK